MAGRVLRAYPQTAVLSLRKKRCRDTSATPRGVSSGLVGVSAWIPNYLMHNILKILAFLVLLCFWPAEIVGQTYEQVVQFETGENPIAELVEGADGSFYGTTQRGGLAGRGTVFRLRPTGELSTLISFQESIDTGGGPGQLVVGSDGAAYGGYGDTIFRVSPQGVFSTVVKLTEPVTGLGLRGGLLLGRDGNLYGGTAAGGKYGHGTVFRITLEGAVSVVTDFQGLSGTLSGHCLVEDEDGSLYGVTIISSGVTPNLAGSVFRVKKDGSISTLAIFNRPDYGTPTGPLLLAADGHLYGMTSEGGVNGFGTVFRLTRDGELTTVCSLEPSNSSRPRGRLVEGKDGNFYGVIAGSSLERVFRTTPSGVIDYPLGDFPLRSPMSLVAARDGTIYGMTYLGGSFGRGSIFRFATEGNPEQVAEFRDAGREPSGIIETSHGYYGATSTGLGSAAGAGTIFRLGHDGALSTLVRLDLRSLSNPSAALIEGDDGHLYGTTRYGGAYTYGAFIRVTKEGEYTILKSFYSGVGEFPGAALIKGSDGSFYGTASRGGYGKGTVFKVATGGELTQVASFTGSNGAHPVDSLVETEPGVFYGVAAQGGEYESGTFFRITTDGELMALYSFAPASGSYPHGLMRADDGFFYGVTTNGGATNQGTVFRISIDGTHTVLTHFNGGNGSSPSGGLLMGPDGRIYGTTFSGGAHQSGTVFAITREGVLETIHHFDGNAERHPRGALYLSQDGDIYGAAYASIFRVAFPRRPSVFTGSATQISRTGAVLNGLVNPHRALTSASFEIFDPQAQASPLKVISATEEPLAPGVTDRQVTAAVSGLSPGMTYLMRAVAENAVGRYVGELAEFTTEANEPPVAMPDQGVYAGEPLTLPVLSNDEDSDGDELTLSSVTDGAVGRVTIDGDTVIYTPGPSFLGRDSFTYEVSDGFGGVSAGRVDISASVSVMAAVASSTVDVPGAGEPDSGIPAGARYTRFGIPSLQPDGGDGWMATVKVPSGAFTGIFEDGGSRMLLSSGDPAVDEAGTHLSDVRFKSFRDPVFAGAGRFAVVARVMGKGVGPGSDEGLWANSGGLLQCLALEGGSAPGVEGGKFARFTSVAISEEGYVFFTADLKPGKGGVSAANNNGLWIASPGQEGMAVTLAFQTGWEFVFDNDQPRRVKSFRTLTHSKGTPGEGKMEVEASVIPLWAKFTDGSEGVGRVFASGEVVWEALSGEHLQTGLEGLEVIKFGSPDFCASLPGFASIVTARERGAGGARKTDAVVFDSVAGILAQKGKPAPGTAGVFLSFSDPVLGNSGSPELPIRFQAVIGKLQQTKGAVASGNDTGIWIRSADDGSEVRLLAREGDDAPGAGGALFSSFDSLAILPGRGAIFCATLRSPQSTSASARITRKNRRGIWAMNSSGELVQLLRAGASLRVGNSERVIRDFVFLSAVPSSLGQRRSVNSDQIIIYRAHFEDGTSAVMKMSVP